MIGERVYDIYTLMAIITFPIASIAFGIFYAKNEGKSKGFGVLVGLAAIALSVVMAFVSPLLARLRLRPTRHVFPAFKNLTHLHQVW